MLFRSPLGRVLKPVDLPLKAVGENLLIQGPIPSVRWIYPLIFSDMSIGALSARAWEAIALATAYLNEECGMPVRMCSGEGGVPGALLQSERIRYMILQIASGHFGWNRIISALPKMKADPYAANRLDMGRDLGSGQKSPVAGFCALPHLDQHGAGITRSAGGSWSGSTMTS